jgi:translocator protein
MTSRATSKQQALGFVVCLLVSFAAAVGAVFTAPAWYSTLHRPSWSPSPSVFGPVWTTLYLLIAISVWLVWRNGGWSQQRRALVVFSVQWIFNAAWTPVFFGLQRIDLALVDILLLWTSIVATIIVFRRVKLAAVLLLPYLAWVTIATALNFRIWQLN